MRTKGNAATFETDVESHGTAGLLVSPLDKCLSCMLSAHDLAPCASQMLRRHFGGCSACLEKAPHVSASLESGQNGGFASIYALSNGVNINKRMSVCVCVCVSVCVSV